MLVGFLGGVIGGWLIFEGISTRNPVLILGGAIVMTCGAVVDGIVGAS